MTQITKCAAIAVLSLLVSGHALAAPDASHGEEVYQSCQDCHSLDTNDLGPKHRGVFGGKPALSRIQLLSGFEEFGLDVE